MKQKVPYFLLQYQKFHLCSSIYQLVKCPSTFKCFKNYSQEGYIRFSSTNEEEELYISHYQDPLKQF